MYYIGMCLGVRHDKLLVYMYVLFPGTPTCSAIDYSCLNFSELDHLSLLFRLTNASALQKIVLVGFLQ